MTLSAREADFVTAYLVDPNATRAAAAAGYAPSYGRRLRWKTAVADAIGIAQAERSEAMRKTADQVVEQLSRIAFSDVGDVIEHQRVNCRHCHGRDFHRQHTKAELLDRWEKGLDMDPEGAGVFDPWGEPNIDCPQCGGLGESAAFVKDSRYMSPTGRALYAGLKHGPRGWEIVMHDKVKALVQLGRHLGLFNPKRTERDGPTHEEALARLR